MRISLKNSPDRSRDPALYRFKPQPIPLHIKPQARDLIGKLELQGVIRKMEANEQSEFCAPSGFVSKKSGKLRFVIDFTALNKYVRRPVHSFPSSDQVAQSLKPGTTHIACVDFPSGYFADIDNRRLFKIKSDLMPYNQGAAWDLIFMANKKQQQKVSH